MPAVVVQLLVVVTLVLTSMAIVKEYRNIVNKGHPEERGSIITSPIVIKNYAWISFNVIILKESPT